MNNINNLMQSQRNQSHYSDRELQKLGFISIGKNVLISKFARIYGASQMSIGSNVRIDDFVILSGKITLGNFVHLATFSGITAGSIGVELGNFCSMSSYSKIFATTDDLTGGYLGGPCVPDSFRGVIEKPVILTKHCYIGSHSLVLPGGYFEIGACLGPMSLVGSKRLKSWNYYFGNPARAYKQIDKNSVLQKEKELLSTMGGGRTRFLNSFSKNTINSSLIIKKHSTTKKVA